MDCQKEIYRLGDAITCPTTYRIITMAAQFIQEILPIAEQEMKISELHLSSSFVHLIIEAIFKLNIEYSPHCADHSDGGVWRPDYIVSKLDTGEPISILCGEIKPSSCKDMKKIEKDKIKVAVYAKQLIDKQHYNYLIGFIVVGKGIHFHLLSNSPGGLILNSKIESIQFPVEVDFIKTLVDTFSIMLKVSLLFPKSVQVTPILFNYLYSLYVA
jgi:hypothetical protein